MTFIGHRVYRRRGSYAARLRLSSAARLRPRNRALARPAPVPRAPPFASVRSACYPVRPEQKRELFSWQASPSTSALGSFANAGDNNCEGMVVRTVEYTIVVYVVRGATTSCGEG